MRTIYKYPIPVRDKFTLELPRRARFVHLALQGTDTDHTPLFAWFDVDTDAPLEERRFYLHGTGHPIWLNEVHLGTVLVGAFVWHLYEPVLSIG